MDEGPKRPKPPIRAKRAPAAQDLSTAYVSSIVNTASRQPERSDDESEAQKRFEMDEERIRGELIINDAPQFDSVSNLSSFVLRSLLISSFKFFRLNWT